MKRTVFFSLALTTALGCGGSDAVVTRPPADESKPDDWTQTGADAGPASVLPRPEQRVGRRLTVRQIDRSLQTLFGKSWSLQVGSQSLEIFPILAPMLGQPDYLSENIESIDPTPLFSKFMDNMASKLCTDQLLLEYSSAPPPKPLIVRYPNDVDANLRYLRLRFHGIYVAPGSTKELGALRTLYTELRDNAALPSNLPKELLGWIGVCVALLTDPEMMTY